jgi:hypothetical protein
MQAWMSTVYVFLNLQFDHPFPTKYSVAVVGLVYLESKVEKVHPVLIDPQKAWAFPGRCETSTAQGSPSFIRVFANFFSDRYRVSPGGRCTRSLFFQRNIPCSTSLPLDLVLAVFEREVENDFTRLVVGSHLRYA